MAMKRCPVCGEKYSDTYRSCPFCEEEAAMRSGDAPRRRGGGRRVAGKGGGVLSPILILVILILSGLLIYLFFGDAIAQRFFGNSSGNQAAVSSGVSSAESSSSAITEPDVSEPSSSKSEDTVPETAVTLSKEDFTLNAGETYTLTAANGGGKYTWESTDDGVASVSEDGKVTAISSGTATISVTDGYTTAECIVRVKGTASGTTTSDGTYTISREDITLPVGDTFQLKVSGGTANVGWTSSNTGVAKVSSNGTVTAVSGGTATVTASCGGQTLKCIIRVK